MKAAARAAGAEVVAAELLDKLLIAVYDARTSLDARLGGDAGAAFAHRLESTSGRRRVGNSASHTAAPPPPADHRRVRTRQWQMVGAAGIEPATPTLSMSGAI